LILEIINIFFAVQMLTRFVCKIYAKSSWNTEGDFVFAWEETCCQKWNQLECV